MSMRLYIVRAAVAAALCGGVSAAAPAAPRDLKLAVFFRVKSTGPVYGSFPAHLVWSKGQVSGMVSFRYNGQKYPCVVQQGSTDIDYKLTLTCAIGTADIVTLDGKLNLLTGSGRGTLSDTLFGETGTYTTRK